MESVWISVICVYMSYGTSVLIVLPWVNSSLYLLTRIRYVVSLIFSVIVYFFPFVLLNSYFCLSHANPCVLAESMYLFSSINSLANFLFQIFSSAFFSKFSMLAFSNSSFISWYFWFIFLMFLSSLLTYTPNLPSPAYSFTA